MSHRGYPTPHGAMPSFQATSQPWLATVALNLVWISWRTSYGHGGQNPGVNTARLLLKYTASKRAVTCNTSSHA
ncbi:hypothetical protein BDM02DRAFT_3113433 [Thelephora ganbajun]|uniref:Uncharacterized protein n=1 Tax=Thelephora ganbajun TaxID=370292 RepID=A0ACB6ZJQ8_THEGA|nr:hypothetical protein BDM02DRAFT_3113433 [Thelephora ganbajun]